MSKLLGTEHSLGLISQSGVNMGQMKESNMKTEALEDSAKLKGEANDEISRLLNMKKLLQSILKWKT